MKTGGNKSGGDRRPLEVREWQSRVILDQTIQSKELGTGRATDKAKEGEGGNFVSSFTEPAYEAGKVRLE